MRPIKWGLTVSFISDLPFKLETEKRIDWLCLNGMVGYHNDGVTHLWKVKDVRHYKLEPIAWIKEA